VLGHVRATLQPPPSAQARAGLYTARRLSEGANRSSWIRLVRFG
jgi:hypothetical protein